MKSLPLRTRFVLLFVAVCMAALVSSGCEPFSEGKEGNLEFNYDNDDSLFEGGALGVSLLNRPMAVGAEVELNVHEASTSGSTPRAASVSSASSSRPSVAEVLRTQGSQVILQGISPGIAEITVSTSGGVSDRVDVKVDAIHALTIAPHPAWGKNAEGAIALIPPEAHLNGSVALFTLSRTDREGARLLDKGLAGPTPVFEPTDAATLEGDFSPFGSMTFSKAGDIKVTLTEPSDPSVTSEHVLSVVDISDVTTIELININAEDNAVHMGQKFAQTLDMRSRDGLLVVGAETVGQIASSTPEICTVNFDDLQLGIAGLVQVEGLAVGTCNYTLTLDQRTEDFSIEVQEAETTSDGT